ncbi:hypothetical protein SAMN05421749_102328 [Acinetobacter marinus]|uniref:Uncharacterized protein n=1 Tax=Acinetobacter marinus TaxID=281375 RepID=A0A1G6HJJ7_9GAMM|nr:hypothetical protein [Acinetobacter marinus]SDB94429.1 hypothetical protein SAMN05421749_102328 [Acinetobacter marinus]
MDIEKLLKKRQLNVQEQNFISKHRIYQEALYWRKQGVPELLREIAIQHHIDVEHSIFLEYEQDSLGGSTDEGIILTPDYQFYEFDIDFNPDRTALLQVYVFRNITDRYEVNAHQRGKGATWGSLAIDVLNELNQQTNSEE